MRDHFIVLCSHFVSVKSNVCIVLFIDHFDLIMGYKNWVKVVWIEDDGKERIGVIPEPWLEEDKNIVWWPPAAEKTKAFIKSLTPSSTWESITLIKVTV